MTPRPDRVAGGDSGKRIAMLPSAKSPDAKKFASGTRASRSLTM
jgi:hypothetical protein